LASLACFQTLVSMNPHHSNPAIPRAESSPALRLKGFTLIELLTVIAIIGILAAIIIPTVGKVRGLAKEAKKSSLYRQYGIAVNLYAIENKDSVCPVYDNNLTGNPSFQALLLPYLNLKSTKSDFFYYEPSDPIFATYSPAKPFLNGTGMNTRILLPQKNTVNDGVSGGSGVYYKMTNITYPQYRIVIGDCPIITYSIDPLKPDTLDTSRHADGKKGMFLRFNGSVALYTQAQAEMAMKDPVNFPNVVN